MKGGFFDNPTNAIERYDLQKNIWEEIDYFPNNRAKFGAISLPNGNIVVIGGKQVFIFSKIIFYDLLLGWCKSVLF